MFDRSSEPGRYRPTSQDLEDELVDILHVVMRIAERYRIDIERAQQRARRRELKMQTIREPEGAPRLRRADVLSDREVEVLQLVAAGLSNREIAQRIVVAAGTVKRHVHNIYRKLGVHCRTQAVRQGLALGLIAS